jgi:hypothetical protein
VELRRREGEEGEIKEREKASYRGEGKEKERGRRE